MSFFCCLARTFFSSFLFVIRGLLQKYSSRPRCPSNRFTKGTYEGLDRHPGEDERVSGELRVTLLAYSQITQRPCFLRSSGASMGTQISGKLRIVSRSGELCELFFFFSFFIARNFLPLRNISSFPVSSPIFPALAHLTLEGYHLAKLHLARISL